jgi:hypothetical protein
MYCGAGGRCEDKVRGVLCCVIMSTLNEAVTWRMAHCIGVRVCALQTARERDRERDRTIVICCKYSSAVPPTEVSSIHFSSLMHRSLLCLSFYVFRLSTFVVFVYPVVTNKLFHCRLHFDRIFPSCLSVLSVSCLMLYCGFSSDSYR